MKKVFLNYLVITVLALMTAAFTSCNRNENGDVKLQGALAAENIPAQTVTGSKAGLFLWDGKITVQISNKDILSKYRSVVEFVDKDAPKEQRLIFYTTAALRDFKYIAIQLNYNEEQGQSNIVENDIKYSIDKLLPERPFVVNWTEAGTMPHAGISFIDENNVKRYFAIITNNAEPEEDARGPVLLIEYPLLQAQELDFPPKINLFQYSKSVPQGPLYGLPNTRIWGWSNNGKVAYSAEREIDGRGGQVIDFVILDLISDNIVFELKMDSFDHNDATDEALYNLFKGAILNALKVHNIVRQKTEFSPFPIRKNNMVYNSQIMDVEKKNFEYAFDTVVSKYAVVVTANDKRKIIGNFTPVHTATGHVYVCGYFLSPFENRALVVVAEEHWGHEGTELTYRLSGCHLGTGFK